MLKAILRAPAPIIHPDYEYANWRIESLEWTYTYDNLDGLALDIYWLNGFVALIPSYS